MSAISYFQKYSQKENHITNNTLLMFRHIYRHSPLRFEGLLKQIVSDSNFEIGLSFQQQIKAQDSVPDALIKQSSLNIYIEAKAHGELYEDQIQRHINSIEKESLPSGSSLIIGLCKKRNRKQEEEFKKLCKDKRIQFALLTYSELLDMLGKQCPEYETDLYEIIEDYGIFLREEGMLLNLFEMVAFPCGTSWNENIRFGIYYEKASKPSKSHSPFVGIYDKKKITHLGQLRSTVLAKIEKGKLIFEYESGSFLEKDRSLIKAVIEATTYYNLGDDLHRYYLIDTPQEINIEKRSSGGIRGHRYFDLQSFIEKPLLSDTSLKEIAKLIANKSFT